MACNRRIPFVSRDYNDHTGEYEERYTSVSECNFKDISLHSYMCTTCGERFWYSERGKIAEQSGRDVHDVSYDEVKK